MCDCDINVYIGNFAEVYYDNVCCKQCLITKKKIVFVNKLFFGGVVE